MVTRLFDAGGRMRHRGSLVIISGWLCMALPAPAHAQSPAPIRVAIGAPLTGGAATFGVEMKQAVELAIDERNAAGGILGARVAAVVADDAASASTGQTVAEQFCD